MMLNEKLTEKNWMTRIGVGAALSIGALGLAGCSTEGPESGTDVEDVQENAEEVEEQVEEEVEDAAQDAAFEGPYTDEFYGDTESLDGEYVIVSANVNEILSDNAFTIAGTDETTVDELLITHDGTFTDLEEGLTVQVSGTVNYLFSIEDVEGDFTDDLFIDYENTPYIDASDIDAIVDGDVVDDELEE